MSARIKREWEKVLAEDCLKEIWEVNARARARHQLWLDLNNSRDGNNKIQETWVNAAQEIAETLEVRDLPSNKIALLQSCLLSQGIEDNVFDSASWMPKLKTSAFVKAAGSGSPNKEGLNLFVARDLLRVFRHHGLKPSYARTNPFVVVLAVIFRAMEWQTVISKVTIEPDHDRAKGRKFARRALKNEQELREIRRLKRHTAIALPGDQEKEMLDTLDFPITTGTVIRHRFLAYRSTKPKK